MIKVLSVPHIDGLGSGESGIHTVIRAYFRHAKDYGIEFVPPKTSSYDVLAIHAGMVGTFPKSGPTVAHTHGLYWTGDYNMPRWAYGANANVISSARYAREVTVPSEWVAETFRRDMRLNPHIVPHGIEWDKWQVDVPDRAEYIIGYAKNRAGVDVCNPSFLSGFANRFPNRQFVTTFAPENSPDNVNEVGLLSHDEMKRLILYSSLFISTTKETWGITILEAMASGVPVLAFDQGGAKELVTHGVTGYLARPNDYEDLAVGLEYCMKYKNVLGENAREIARQFTWDRSMEALLRVYQEVIKPSPPTVGVVIPVYNKSAEELTNCLDSVLSQTVKADQIVVVDDGSTNGIDYKSIAKSKGASFVHQPNSGVAVARNKGISTLNTKYVLCLDPDDAILPQFLEACVPALEEDNSLGIAYTGLHWVKPDGSEGDSEWPGEFDFDRHILGQNQVPTACVFRREAWERTGGYHSRYAPQGCGEEDANLWLRMGGIGYGAKKVTEQTLFRYAWQSGYVSGNRKHQATDWRGWLPWTRGYDQPFASVATPTHMSHQVRQYDEPSVSVIIPVVAGHEKFLPNALDSLEAQTFYDWEAIVVWDLKPDDEWYWWNEWFKKAYPYVIHTFSGVGGTFPKGAGKARNRGVELSRADYLVFLDADDHFHPEFLEKSIAAYGVTGNAIYTDYIGKAVVENVEELATSLQNNIIARDERTKVTAIRYKAGEFECETAMRQPTNPPYIWNNITTLVPKAWHYEIGGFDEKMKSWEDVDYWWRMAWSGKCFSKIAEPLMVYRFYTGGRREDGLKSWDELLSYLSKKKRREYNAV